jgi:leucyl aminopeptidase
MLELPDFQPLAITTRAREPAQRTLDALDHLAIVVPERPAASLLRTLPAGRRLLKLLNRSTGQHGRMVGTHLDNGRPTAVVLAEYRAQSAFGTLTWARQLVAECARRRPRALGLLIAGLDADAASRAVQSIAAAAAAHAFTLPHFKSKPDEEPVDLRRLDVFGIGAAAELGLTRATALGNNIARWFTAMPPNKLTALTYRVALESMAQQFVLDFEFIDESRLRKLGAGAFLAVAQGNAQRDAGIVHLRYRPARTTRAQGLALVGKGILFDTGGTNLKPFKSMLDMHIDMQGSAVALGTLAALATLKVPYPVDAWLALSENRLSAEAYKPQDVVVALNGTSIQVIHTDAEGRMVLADTLALAARAEPALMIDFATLTGSCIAALTERYSGVFTNRPGAATLLYDAGHASGERVWPFPMDADFDEALRSETADVKQCAADGQGDHILAARFLSRFVPDAVPWVHVDLSAGQHKGGLAHIPTDITGFGVAWTLELLRGCDAHLNPLTAALRGERSAP